MKAKLLIKTHMRVTEDMAQQVSALAALEHRPIQDQYRFLVALALQILRSRSNGNGDGNGRSVTHDDAQPIPAPPHSVANGRTVTSKTA